MKAIFIIIFIAWTSGLYSQNKNKDPKDFIAHRFGIKSYSLEFLHTEEGYGGKISYSKVNRNATISDLSLGWDYGDVKPYTKYNNIFCDYVHFYNLINQRNNLFFNIGGGGYIAYEMQKNDVLNKDKNSLGAGVLANAEIEIFFNRIAVVGAFEQIYKPKTEIGNWQYRIDVGVRYLFK